MLDFLTQCFIIFKILDSTSQLQLDWLRMFREKITETCKNYLLKNKNLHRSLKNLNLSSFTDKFDHITIPIDGAKNENGYTENPTMSTQLY